MNPRLKLVLIFIIIVSAGYTFIEISKIVNPPILNLSQLNVQSSGGIFYPEFSPEVKHYAASCGNEESTFITLAATDNDVQISVNGRDYNSAQNQMAIDNLQLEDDIQINLSYENYSEKYYVHCIGNDFPKIEIIKKGSGVDSGFLIINPKVGDSTYLLIIDNNGVPRFRRIINGHVTNFNRHFDRRYSYALRTDSNEFGHWDNTIVILNSHFEEERRVITNGLNHTDNHEFLITPNETFILISYNSAYRDLSKWGLSDNELTRDSVIQELNTEGDIIFEWNSWDHVDVNNCLNHRFPDDYAHINSVQIAPDNNLIASLRGCSQVIKIDRVSGSGDNIWTLGGANSTFEITGDSFEEFCGQHTAWQDSVNNLFMFDNGGHCNGSREQNYGSFSRVLQYSLDMDSLQARFVKDYSLNETYSEYTIAGGSFFITENGNWLINWGRGLERFTEVSSDGTVQLEVLLSYNNTPLALYRVSRANNIELPINVNGVVNFEYFEN